MKGESMICEFCGREESDVESALNAFFLGTTKYAVCPQCEEFIPLEQAASPEWQKKVDGFVPERKHYCDWCGEEIIGSPQTDEWVFGEFCSGECLNRAIEEEAESDNFDRQYGDD